MLYGMGTVFVFLTLLVFCTLAMSWVLSLLPAEEIPEPKKSMVPAPVPATDPKLVAIIEAAIAQHRSR